jgi:spore coat protein JB
MTNKTYHEMLEHLAATSFALDEMILYLDTHPTDKVAIAYYQKCKIAAEEAVREYESAYGPLIASRAQVNDVWTWAKTPWPWEMGER